MVVVAVSVAGDVCTHAHTHTLKAEVTVSVWWVFESRHGLLDLRDRDDTSQAKTG